MNENITQLRARAKLTSMELPSTMATTTKSESRFVWGHHLPRRLRASRFSPLFAPLNLH